MSGDKLSGLEVIQHDDTKNYRYYRVSSNERISGTPYNFVVNFGNLSELDRVTEVHLISASIPNVSNNISVDIVNNTFLANGSVTGVISVVVPDGFYNTSGLITYLQTEINNIITPNTVTITQNTSTNRIEYVVTGETIQFLSVDSGSTISDQIGILTDSAFLASYTSDSLPSLNGNTMIYVHSSQLATAVTLLSSASGGVTSVNGAFGIPVNVPYGVYQYYQGTELDRHVYGKHGKSIKNFTITLRGNGGRLLTEITDNFEVVLVIKTYWHNDN